jgi:hypothetical protein
MHDRPKHPSGRPIEDAAMRARPTHRIPQLGPLTPRLRRREGEVGGELLADHTSVGLADAIGFVHFEVADE